eukprot:5170186-Amphidinium_carterae.1
MDDRYWDKEVRRPALAFVARGQAMAKEAVDRGLTAAPKRQPFSSTSGASRKRRRASLPPAA